MNSAESLPCRAGLKEYQQQAQTLLDAVKAADNAAQWRFKWLHPRFRGKMVNEVKAAALDLADAQLVVAHEYAFEEWADLVAFTEAVREGGHVGRFEAAVEAVIAGDALTLRSLLK